MRYYKSKIDAWFIVIMVAGLATALVPIVLEPAPQKPEFWLTVAMTAGVFALVIWLCVGTGYAIDGNQLTVKSGPFSWTIRISDIESVTRSRTLLSGPALSLDRLVIRYNGGKRLIISPENPNQFIRAIGF